MFSDSLSLLPPHLDEGKSILTAIRAPQTLLTAISMVRDERGQTPPVIQQFLVDLLAYNDNLGNKVRFPSPLPLLPLLHD